MVDCSLFKWYSKAVLEHWRPVIEMMCLIIPILCGLKGVQMSDMLFVVRKCIDVACRWADVSFVVCRVGYLYGI